MNIDTLVVDLEAMQLVVVRRALVGAKLDATKLELGTWSQNTPYDQQKLPVEVAALANAGKSGGPHG